MSETKTLIKSMIHSGFQLLGVALIVGVIIGSVSLVITYFDNIIQGVMLVNNSLVPIKHFIQDHIWYFIVGWCFYLIWWFFVWKKIPTHHVDSLVVLRNIIFPPAIAGFIILLCIANMLEGGQTALFYFISALYVLGFFVFLDEINKYIANRRYKLSKKSE